MHPFHVRLGLLGMAISALAACGDDARGGGGGGSTSTSSGEAGAGGGGAGGAGGAGIEPEMALVHRVGRFDDSDPERPASSWSGTSFRTRVDGDDLSVRLDGAAGVFFQIVVDGAVTGRFETSGGEASYPLAAGLRP